jgi:ATP/maltotriose-dependent transcriptional regulator MalT
MSESLLNILSESNKDIDNQKLMDYLSGRLSEEGKHEVEKWMIDNPFFNEAVEGLQQAGDEKKVQSSVDQINRQLAHYLQQKKLRKSKRKLPANPWTYIAVLVILMLAVLVYLVVSKL